MSIKESSPTDAKSDNARFPRHPCAWLLDIYTTAVRGQEDRAFVARYRIYSLDSVAAMSKPSLPPTFRRQTMLNKLPEIERRRICAEETT